jgi:diguanylate cyclase (GGDEF)-like protein/PAS domain S-box-containing protein
MERPEEDPRPWIHSRRYVAILLLVGLGAALAGLPLLGPGRASLAFALFLPLVSFLAIRFGPVGAAIAALLAALVAALATFLGRGPFRSERLDLGLFIAALTVTALALAAVFQERRRLQDRQRLANEIFLNTAQGIVVTDPHGLIQSVNPAFERITGFTEAEVLGRNPRLLKSGSQDPEFYRAMWRSLATQGSWEGEFWNRRKDGEVYPEEISINAILDARGRPKQYVGIFSDITMRKRAEDQLRRLSAQDGLTGLANRRTFDEALESEWARSVRSGLALALVFVDIDHFKRFNDTFGHQAGDECLRAVALTLQELASRAGDLVARYGGEEFVVLLPSTSLEQARTVAERLRAGVEALRIPHGSSDAGDFISISLGVAGLKPTLDDIADELLRRADLALYAAKAAGRDQVSVA